ncbi:MAG: hypothetical protein QM483_11620 [Desulfuromusa sp.]
MEKILFAWVGSTNLRAAQGEEKAGSGSIAHVAATNNNTRIILLDNYVGKEDVAVYIDWLKKKCSAKDAVNQSSINQTDVNSFEIRVPSMELQVKFAEVKNKFFDMQNTHVKVTDKNNNLFNSLVQRAFRGEL